MSAGVQTTATKVWDLSRYDHVLDERHPVIVDLPCNGGGVSGKQARQGAMADVLTDLYAMRDVATMDVGSDLKLVCVMELVGNGIERYQSKQPCLPRLRIGIGVPSLAGSSIVVALLPAAKADKSRKARTGTDASTARMGDRLPQVLARPWEPAADAKRCRSARRSRRHRNTPAAESVSDQAEKLGRRQYYFLVQSPLPYRPHDVIFGRFDLSRDCTSKI
jgi:hypothetical protein